MAVVDTKPFEYRKQPAESEIIGVNFSRRMPPSTTIAAYSVTSSLWNNTPEQIAAAPNLGDHLEVSGVALVGKVLTCLISKGLSTYNYKVTFKITLSDLQVKEEDVFVKVIEE